MKKRRSATYREDRGPLSTAAGRGDAASGPKRRPVARRRRPAFTLIELLVVIAIISLIISILLPSLSGARRAAQRVACLAGMRGTGQAQASYATDTGGWIAGSPQTTGLYLRDTNAHYSGPAVQRWDFMGPLAEVMGLAIPWGDGSPESVANRFNAIRSHPAFLCRSNNFLSTYFPTAGAPNAGTGRMVSFNTVRAQLTLYDASIQISNEGQGLVNAGNNRPGLPGGYGPSVERLGSPANKIYCADGARYSSANSGEQVQPDYDLAPAAGYGGAFCDTGAWANFTRSWDRARAPRNGYLGPIDGRMWGFRHSNAQPPVGAAGNAYRVNLLFHDGHGETQGDLEATNPHQWLPQGTQVGPSDLWRDTRDHFGITTTIRIGP